MGYMVKDAKEKVAAYFDGKVEFGDLLSEKPQRDEEGNIYLRTTYRPEGAAVGTSTSLAKERTVRFTETQPSNPVNKS